MADETQTTKEQAAGGPGPHTNNLVLRIQLADGETVAPLLEAVVQLGRSPDNHIRVPSKAVGDVHAKLVREGNSYRFHQLDTDHPTLLRGSTVVDHLLE